MAKPFAQCSLPDFLHEISLAARAAASSGSALDAAAAALLLQSVGDAERTEAVLQRHPLVRGSQGLVCSAAADSKQAWCSMLRDLFLGAGVSVSDAARLRVFLLVKQCAELGRVRLPQAASPAVVVQFSMCSGGGFAKKISYARGPGQGQGMFQAETRGGDVVNSVCARMRGGSLDSLRLLDYAQNRQWPGRVVEIVSGRWCLQLFAALEPLHGARVFFARVQHAGRCFGPRSTWAGCSAAAPAHPGSSLRNGDGAQAAAEGDGLRG